ncbi:MAG TPA: SET domain-containing protein-lysine N-methyltransferase [Acidimicrobiales bacterium]
MEKELVVRPVEGKGRGVVAARSFRRYEVVDSASVVVLSPEDWAAIEGTVLGQYAFRWGDETVGERALALSTASFFNHSYTPNTCPKLLVDDLRIDFLAMDDIPAGDELTFNYNGRPSDGSPLWFMPTGG